MIYIRQTFQEEKFQTSKNLKCPICGKSVKRQCTFSQTINPFNKTKDGKIKDWRDIRSELIEEANEWKKKPEKCTKCKASTK